MLGYSESRVIGGTPPAPPEMFFVKTTKQTSFSIQIYCSVYNRVTINWGDGTSTLVNNGVAKTKSYAVPGEYTVTMTGELDKVIRFISNNQGLTEIGLHSDLVNLEYLIIDSNANLSGILRVPEGNTKLWNLHAYSCNLSEIHLDGSSANWSSGQSSLLAQSNPSLTSFTANLIESIRNFSVYNCTSLSVLEMDSVYSCGIFRIDYSGLSELRLPNLVNKNVEVNPLQTNNCQNLHTFYAPNFADTGRTDLSYCPNLQYITLPSNFKTSIFDLNRNVMATPLVPAEIGSTNGYPTLRYSSMGLSQSEVDYVLAAAKSIVITSGSYKPELYLHNITGGSPNATPSATGRADAAWLRLNGWRKVQHA